MRLLVAFRLPPTAYRLPPTGTSRERARVPSVPMCVVTYDSLCESAPGTSVRISKIEIIGSTLMNR